MGATERLRADRQAFRDFGLDRSPTAKRVAQLERINSELRLKVERLSRLVYIDELTQLTNRRFFDLALNTELRRAARERSPLTLLLCDADDFKLYNDSFGHQAGDDALRHLGRALRQACRRAGDVAARFGGEEFALILPGVDGYRGVTLAERLRRGIEALASADTRRLLPGRLTVSIGVTAFRRAVPCPASALVGAADEALYLAKNDGRNTVRFRDLDDFAPR